MSHSHSLLFSPYTLGDITLQNRVVMAPMTRSRAVDNLPNELIESYYTARAEAGLIITEGTAPSPDGLGYARIPGLYNNKQAKAWKKVTDAVHANGGKIFVQLMHTGRISHPANLPAEGEVIGASAVAAGTTKMYTDQHGLQELPVPAAVDTEHIPLVIEEFVHSARLAIAAGFDGVELHAANGYLLEQFLNAASNTRTDKYGGTPANRNRFVLEVAAAVAHAIGINKTGIRLSPFGVFNDIIPDDTTLHQYTQLATALKEIGLVYIHVIDHAAMGAPEVPQLVKDAIRSSFGATIILSGGYDADRAEADLENNKGELVAFGRPFISNPDLVKRLANGLELAPPDFATFYTPGEKGYTDYPIFEEELQEH